MVNHRDGGTFNGNRPPFWNSLKLVFIKQKLVPRIFIRRARSANLKWVKFVNFYVGCYKNTVEITFLD